MTAGDVTIEDLEDISLTVLRELDEQEGAAMRNDDVTATLSPNDRDDLGRSVAPGTS